MTKQELLQEVTEMSFVDSLIGDPKLVTTRENGDKEYQQAYREITGNVVNYQSFQFYILAENTPEERAFYSFAEPKAKTTA